MYAHRGRSQLCAGSFINLPLATTDWGLVRLSVWTVLLIAGPTALFVYNLATTREAERQREARAREANERYYVQIASNVRQALTAAGQGEWAERPTDV